MTVLFVDLVGSTSFQESVDPEAARGAMTRYYDMVQRVVDQHQGTVAKFQGDGALAVFGVPEVAEDDAARAVATGVALQQAFAEIRDYVADRYRVEVGLRVGINTGEVVIAAEDADLVGDVLNTAARLEAACTPGRVMVGEDTWRLTRSTVTYEVLGEISVKGKAEPIATFQVVEDVAFDAADQDVATPFVGREAELADLSAAYRVAGQTTSARLVTVIGAPGVGKTRLAAELVASLPEGQAFDLRCERAGTSTFAPIADLLRSVADLTGDQSGAQVEASVADWLGAAPDAERLRPLLSSFVGGAETFSTEELFFGARRLVELVAQDAPAVIVVDDIQWAEPLLLDLLEHLIEWVTDAHVLVIGLARPELREIRPSLAQPGRRVEAALSLEGLDAQATAELAAKLVGADNLPGDLLARLPESTEGNPLFVRELMQMLVDDGVIARGPAGWALTIDADAVDVPPTIQSLLSTRVERMPVDERRLVELAAVVGPDFARGAVAAITDGWSPGQVDDVFRRLERKELIEPTGSYWGNEPIYRFHHVLIRDAAYRRLLKGSRAELHLLVAEWTEQTASALTGEHEVSIAHHYEQAYIYRRELGLDDDETTAAGTRAAALLTVAADRALARDDLPAAGSLALRAIDCLAADAAEVPALLLTANEALLSSGDVARATSALEKLESYADEERLRQWAACFRGQLTVLADPAGLDVAADRLDEAAATLDRLDDAAGVAKARQIRALALASLGRVGDCEAELDRALTAARKADDRRRVTAVLGAAPIAALWGPSPVPRAGGRCLDVIRLLRITTGSPAVEATSIRCQAVLEALRGRFETARTMLGTARETAEEMGLRRDLMETEFYAGLVELLADDAVAAEPHLRRAYDGLDRLGIGADAGQAAAHLARALLIQGRIDEAEELAGTSDALAGQNTQTAIAARSVRAEVLSARGRHDEAVPLAQEAVAIASGTDILVDHAQALAALARVQAAAGQTADADTSAANARVLFDQKGATVEVGTVAPAPSDAQVVQERASLGGNACTALIDRVLGILGVGETPVFDDLSEELVVEDHRSDVNFGTLDRASYQAQVESMAEVGARPERLDWLALRGDTIALGYLTMSFGDSYSRRLLVVYRTNEETQCDRISFFDEDDITGAYGQMEEWFLDSLDPADREPWATIARWVGFHNEGDVEAMEAWMHRDLQVVDHGTLGWGSFDRDTAVARFAETAGALEYAFPTRILRYGSGASLSSHRYQYHDGAAIEGYALTYNTTDTTHRAEYFDLDQLDLALRRFEEVTGPDRVPDADTAVAEAPAEVAIGPGLALENRATVEMGKLAEMFRAGDIASGGQLLTDDFVRYDRRSGVAAAPLHGPEAMVTSFEALHALGLLADFDPRPIAIRGDDFALFDTTMAADESAELRVLQLVALRPGSGARQLELFDAEDVPGAVARIDELYIETLADNEAAIFGLVRTHFRAAATGDLSTLAALLHDDAQIVDHQPLGWGRLSAAEYVERIASLEEARTESTLAVVHELSDMGAVFSAAIVRDGELMKFVHWLSRVEAGRHAVIESFDGADLHRALDRYHALGAAGAAGAPSNRCDAAVRELLRRADEHDWTGVDELIAADLEVVTHRTGPTVDTSEAGEFVQEGLRGYGELGFRVISREVLAVRGDDLLLAAMRWATPDGDAIEWLAVEGTDEVGRLAVLVQFDAGDLPAAAAELDRRHAERLPASIAHWGRDATWFTATVVSAHLDALEPRLADDFTSVDHRRLGLGSRSRSDFLASVGARTTTLGHGVGFVPEIYAADADCGLFSYEARTTATDSGSPIVERAVAAVRRRDGQWVDVDLYDFDQLDDARRRYDELRELASVGANTAASPFERVWEQVRTSFNARDWDAFAAVHTPGYRYRSFRRGPSLGRFDSYADYLPQMVERANLGLVLEPQELIASRGDRVALCRVRLHDPSGNVEERINIDVVDTEGRLAELYSFDADDLGAAVGQLDELYLAALPDELARGYRPLLTHTTAMSRGDIETVAAVAHPDLIAVDHRPLGWGQSDHQGWVDRCGSVMSAGYTAITTEVIRLEPSMSLVASEQIDTEAEVDRTGIFLSVYQDGRAVRIESFAGDERTRAIARFDELARGSRTNRERLAEQCMNPYRELGVFAHDLVMDDRRTIVGLDETATGKDVLFDVNDGRPTTRFELIEERDDRVMLHSQTVTDTDAGWESHLLAVNRFDETGICDLLVMFDPTDRDAALAEFERLASALDGSPRTRSSSTEPQNPLVRTMYELVAAGEASDRPAVEDFLAPDLQRVDHRGIGAPPQGRDEWVSTFIDLMNVGEGSFDVVATRGDRLALVDGYRITPDDFEIRFLFLTGADADGRVVHMENFEIDDLAPALARLDDLFVASLDPADRQPFVRVAQGIHARNAEASGRSAMVPPGASFIGDGAIEFPELTEDSDAARLLGAAELGGITVMQPVHVAREGAVLASLRTTLDATEIVWHFVFRAEGDTLSVTYFDEDSLEDARLALDAPSQPPPAVVDRPTNRATDVSDRMSELVRNGHVDDLIDWWTPEAIARDYSRLGQGTGGREEFVTAMRSWREVWDIGQPDTGGPIAINGDHAALVEYRFGTVGSWSVDRLAVLVVDDDDKITELTFYDHEDREIALQALAELDVPGMASTEQPSTHPAQADPSLPSRIGPTNRGDRLARQHGVRFGDGRWRVVETLGVRLDDFALHRIVADDGTTALGLSCWTPSGEQVTAQRFSDDAVQKAFFQLDEWSGDTVGPRLWRQSAIRAWAQATQEHDWATARTLLHPDYTATSHQLLGPDELRGEHLVRWFESMEARAVTFVVATPEVHVMSEAGFVVWEEFEQIDTDGFAISNGGVSVVVVRDGKLAQSARFDDEQLPEAIEMLEEIAAAAGLSDTIVYASEPARALRPQR